MSEWRAAPMRASRRIYVFESAALRHSQEVHRSFDSVLVSLSLDSNSAQDDRSPLRFRGTNLRAGARLFHPGEQLPAAARQVPEDHPSGDGGDGEQQQAQQPFAKDQLADPEQRTVDHQAAQQPIERVAAEVAYFGDFRSQLRDFFPSVDGRTHA